MTPRPHVAIVHDYLNQPGGGERVVLEMAKIWPEAPIYTFWDYFRQHWQKNSGLRIDHLLLDPQLTARLVDAGVDTWVRG